MTRWIQKAKVKKGALSRQLDIPEEEDIPKTLLRKIKQTKSGTYLKNPTQVGRKRYKATSLMKRRASLALTFKKMKRR